MDHAAHGAAALSSGDALTAVSAYTQALIQHPTSPDYFIQRSTAFTRLKAPNGPRHDHALADAEHAVLLGQKRARREKIQAAQQRRVIAFFGLHQYGNAAYVLSTMERWRTGEKKDKMEGDMWKAQIEQRLKALAEDDPARLPTVKEYPERELPSDTAMKKMLQSQLTANGTFKFAGDAEEPDVQGTRTEIVGGDAAKPSDDAPAKGINLSHETTVSSTPPITSPEPPPATSQSLSKIRHEWFQNARNVTITLYAKGVPKNQAEIEIHEDSLSVSFPHPVNPASTFTFSVNPLFALIDVAASRSSVMSTKVEISLGKKMPGQKWNALEGTTSLKESTEKVEDSTAKAAAMSTLSGSTSNKPTEIAPSYPTSSRSGPKNWDKVASDLTAKKSSHKHKTKGKEGETEASGSDQEPQEDDADSDFGGDPVDGFFKKLYAGADPDTRRAMMKSYQESGGTALSTDWRDVGSRKVDPVESKD